MKIFTWTLNSLLTVMFCSLISSSAFAHDCPKENGTLPGCIGSVKLDKLTGDNTFWTDSDGVDPMVPGCHYEWKSLVTEKGKSVCKDRLPPPANPVAKPHNRKDLRSVFGEYCESDTILIESNPEAGVCHKHRGDIGAPFQWDCQVLCKAQGKKGKCETVENFTPPGETESCSSAKCVCS